MIRHRLIDIDDAYGRAYSRCVDVLSDVLARSGARGTVFARTPMSAPWGLRFTPAPRVQFHAVLLGTCWLRASVATEPLRLHQGDFVLVAASEPYELADGPDAPAEPFERVLGRLGNTTGDRVTEAEGPGSRSVLLCGAYDFERTPSPALDGLPEVLHIPAVDGVQHPSMRSVLTVLSDELGAEEPGSQAVVDRLVDVLLVHCLRVWLNHEDEEKPGGPPSRASWLRALRDPDVRRSLEAIHEHPGGPWTVAGLARVAGLSRAAFARRFSEEVGCPPMGYLARWRMAVAAELLRSSDQYLPTIASEVGYENPYAFATAFKRIVGEPPGRYRSRRRRT